MLTRQRQNVSDVFTQGLHILNYRKVFEQCTESPDLRLAKTFGPLTHQYAVGNFQRPDRRYQDRIPVQLNQYRICIAAAFLWETPRQRHRGIDDDPGQSRRP